MPRLAGFADADRPDVKTPPAEIQPLHRVPSKCLRQADPVVATAKTSIVPLPSEAPCWATTVPPRLADPLRMPSWYHVWTSCLALLRVKRSTRPERELVADGASVEVTPAEIQEPHEAPSLVLRLNDTASLVPRMKVVTCDPVRAAVMRTILSSVPLEGVNHSAPSGPSCTARMRP